MATRKVLIPLDGSEFSRQILPVVRTFLDPKDTALILLRVAQPPKGYNAMPSRPVMPELSISTYETPGDFERAAHPVYDSQEWESLLDRLQDELRLEAAELRSAGFTVYDAVKFGDPVREIVDFVQDEDIDLIAMTTHGRSGISRLVFGSVAQAVVREAYVPVLLLRPLEQRAEPLASRSGERAVAQAER